ncbi:hypothetical protein [Pseudomonas nitroreducens]|uniref:hypothetical protein n=1 Tax=Pseudomonas TaxID=286 RepID=UPI00351CC7EC
MKVICKINNLGDISNAVSRERIGRYIFLPDGELDLVTGREYVVYGVVFWDGCPWLYVCPEEHDEYPKPYAIEFFDVVDSRVSEFWRFSSSFEAKGGVMNVSLVFEEWAVSPVFYENLVDGNSDCIRIFEGYRKLMNEE